VDQGDDVGPFPCQAGRQLGQLGPAVASHAEQHGVRAGSLAHRVVHLVAVAEAIDETGVQRFGGEQRRPVDQGAYLVGGEVAAGGDAGHQLLGHRADQALGGLAVGGGERVLGEQVGGVLVLVALGDLRRDAGAVERTPQERDLGGGAREAHVARRLEPDLVERARQVVRHAALAELAERLGPGDRELAVAAELPDGVAELLGAGQGERGPCPAHFDHQGLDPGIACGPSQGIEHRSQRLPPAAEHRTDGARGVALGQGVREVELQEQGRRPAMPRILDPIDDIVSHIGRVLEHDDEATGPWRIALSA
jgi:hypothetical protein